MRITHVIGSLDPAGGGPPQVTARLAAATAARGHQARIVCHHSPHRQEAIQEMLEHVPGFEEVSIHNLDPTSSRWGGLAISRIAGQIDRLVGETDIVHLHGIWEPLLRVVGKSARKQNTPYAVRPAGILDPWSLSQKRFKKMVAMWMGYRQMLNGAAFIHALNADEARLIEPLRLKCPIKVISNGVFIEEIEPLPELGQFRASYPQIGDSPYILFLSRLHYKKGLDYLADIFGKVAASHPTVQLVVAGPDEGAKTPFEQQIERLGLSDRVHLVGSLYGKDKYAAMVDAVCFCLPSRQEGFSVAITEALACGLPVVISEGCHFPEVGKANAGFVLPMNAQAFAEALLKLLSNAELVAEQSKCGAEMVRKNYTWQAVAEQIMTCYDAEFLKRASG